MKYIVLIFMSIAFFACKKVDTPQTADKELITKVGIQLIKTGTTDTTNFYYKIVNNVATADTIRLKTNSSYQANVRIFTLNEQSQEQEITSEIISEKNDHLFIYQSPLSSFSISQLNTDGNGKPFGMQSVWTATTASPISSLRIYLIHLPTDKYATSPTGAGGSTDADVTFPVIIF